MIFQPHEYTIYHDHFLATPDIVAKGQYCLDIKARALEVYEKLFEIEFPLPKLDTLAIPESGPSAMETWVSYRLLFRGPLVYCTRRTYTDGVNRD
jgi:aminopeptidase N